MHVTLKFEPKILRSDFFCPGEPHQRSPNGPKFEDRSQKETEWQEQGAREAAWKLAKNLLNLKEQERATFFSLSENRCLPASTLKPEEREFVVDSGASMHMISEKDLSDAEMDTLTKSCSLTKVITANGEVQTHEEAIVYVKKLDIFLTMKVLENTPAVLSLGKLCDEKTDILMSGSTETGVEYNVIRRTSFRSWFQACHRVLHPVLILRPKTSISSSSSSTSPPTTVLSESETREREDQSGIDSYPVPVSSSQVEEMIERGDPLLPKPTKNTKPNKDQTTIERENRCVPTSRSDCKNSEKIWWMTEFLNTETHTPVLLMNYL